LIGELADMLGPKFFILRTLFSSEGPNAYTPPAVIGSRPTHIENLTGVGYALYCLMLARYGLRGILDFSKPWRGVVFLLAALSCLACGFRGALIGFLLTVAVMFILEGLHKTQLLPLTLGLLVAAGLALIPMADKLPWSMQRTLSFLPLNIDPVVKASAEGSTD